MVGFKVLRNFFVNWGNRLAVLMVKSGLDPHMIIELEDDLNRCFIYDDDYGYFVSGKINDKQGTSAYI